MKKILKNAVLNEEGAGTLVKSKAGQLYGIFDTKAGKDVVPPRYLHIFEFEDENGVAINQQRKYVGLTKTGQEFELTPEKIEEYEQYLVKGDTCECGGEGCQTCKGKGTIFNDFSIDYNFRHIKGFDTFNFDFDY